MKKLLSILLSATLFLSMPAGVVAEDTEIEVMSDWAVESVNQAEALGITEADKNYDFTAPITREDFCELIFNTIIAAQGHFTVTEIPVPFVDTDNYKVKTLYQLGVINGKSETAFAPGDLLTREEAAVMIIRMINTVMPMAATEMYFDYDDMDQVSDWALEAVQVISNLGFMQGVGENRFAPQETYTAEQSIVTLVRIYDATRKIYEYETPLGTITTDVDCQSASNWAIETEARIDLVQDTGNFEATHVMIEKPVKAFTNQLSTVCISFDDFAELFGGTWTIADNRFAFTYDTETMPEVVPYVPLETPDGAEWPNKTEAVDCIYFGYFSDHIPIIINGEERTVHGQDGGKVFDSGITMYENTLYIPVQMVAELMGYDIASLDVFLNES
ncbi:S-layer homology domain-containing protein [Ructibacterium gallinarum]|uniref:S-layer homology domain-containing protein n=1 Tax=Ructibacterium gallinarum TaxID=2779355 RepID=A0A9D5R7G4_9FIRM|nr:S-layer homology domain-containing protein [Ructibacterium gallinarum]MBE5039146.1 S-layer homology domain-containing protein [Ructibacterium gallinarum]